MMMTIITLHTTLLLLLLLDLHILHLHQIVIPLTHKLVHHEVLTPLLLLPLVNELTTLGEALHLSPLIQSSSKVGGIRCLAHVDMIVKGRRKKPLSMLRI